MSDDPIREHEPAPRDVVRGAGLTKDVLVGLSRMAGQTVTVTTPGEVLFDVDGIPNAVGDPVTTTATLAGAVVQRAVLDATGLTAEDVPNLRVRD